MTMSDNELQTTKPTEENQKTATENGLSYGQEVNKVKDSADGGGSESKNIDNCAGLENRVELKFNDQSPPKEKQKRGVYFPTESCVSGFCEPHDPWKHAPQWTAQEVLSAYRRSCEKHGTRPLSRILQQVEILSCNGKRAEKFVLKGEKIDTKQCEAVEEILRRVQFKSIDLESCHLDDETAVAWFDMIEYYESTCYLNVSFNKNIGLRGWQACSRLIRRTPCLTTLDVRNCDMNDRSIPVFGRALKMGSHLTVLHMENMYLSGRSLIILVAALKMNEILQELFLADSRLMPSDGIQLGNLLKYNHSLLLLDVRNNHLQDVGVGHVCDGLYEQNLDRGLKTLVLWNNQVTYQAMPALSRSLASTKCLETLNLGHNNVTNEGIHLVKDGLLKSKSLMRLGLQATKLTCEGAVALAEYVADSVHLLRLDLRENDIKTAGLMALSLALKVNQSVTRLDIDKETKKESGMKDYADQQRRLQQDIQSCMERNQQRVLEREEEERRKLEERAEVEMAARASVQSVLNSAQEAIQAHPEMMYVPASSPEPEKKRRPSLLFQAHRLTPQESLESPHSADVDFFSGKVGEGSDVAVTVSSPPLTLELPNPLTSQSSALPTAGSSLDGGMGLPPPNNPLMARLRSPPSELLLSPQYYPKPTARKIFSVSRVLETSPASPSVSKTGILDTGATGASNMPAMKLSGGGEGDGRVASPISPTILCQDLSVKTVNDYIQRIVSDPDLEPAEEYPSQLNDLNKSLCDEGGRAADRERQVTQSHTELNILPGSEEEEGAEDGCVNLDPLGVLRAEISTLSGKGSNCDSCDSLQGTSLESSLMDGLEVVNVGEDRHSGAVTREDALYAHSFSQQQSEGTILHNIPSSMGGISLSGDCLSSSSSQESERPQPAGKNSPVTDAFRNSAEDTSAPRDGEDRGFLVSALDGQTELVNTEVSGELSTLPQQLGAVPSKDGENRVPPQPVLAGQMEVVSKSESSEQTLLGQQPGTASPPKDSPLFKTMEFPDFDINEEDLSLFGVSSSCKTDTVPSMDSASLTPDQGDKAQQMLGGRDISPGLGDTWTTLDASSLGDQPKTEGEEKQPDFFTSLSLNGLTQELASVLNSIDGTVDVENQEKPAAVDIAGEKQEEETEDKNKNQSTA